jgi:hypothetical protein
LAVAGFMAAADGTAADGMVVAGMAVSLDAAGAEVLLGVRSSGGRSLPGAWHFAVAS